MTVIVSLRDAAGQEVFGEELITGFAHKEPLGEFLPRISEMFARTADDLCLRDGWTMVVDHPELDEGSCVFSTEETLTMAERSTERHAGM